ATVHVGWRSRRSAAAPATCGAAMLVPLKIAQRSCGCAERMLTPGDETSGLKPSETGVGPAEEKSPITSGVPLRDVVTAAAVIAAGAVAGCGVGARPLS